MPETTVDILFQDEQQKFWELTPRGPIEVLLEEKYKSPIYIGVSEKRKKALDWWIAGSALRLRVLEHFWNDPLFVQIMSSEDVMLYFQHNTQMGFFFRLSSTVPGALTFSCMHRKLGNGLGVVMHRRFDPIMDSTVLMINGQTLDLLKTQGTLEIMFLFYHATGNWMQYLH